MPMIRLQCEGCLSQFLTEQNQYVKYFYCKCGKTYGVSPDLSVGDIWKEESIVPAPETKLYQVTYVPSNIFNVFSQNAPGIWNYKDLVIGYSKPKSVYSPTYTPPYYNPSYYKEAQDPDVGYGQIHVTQQYADLIAIEKALAEKYGSPLVQEQPKKKPHPIIQEIAKVFPIVTDRSIATKYRRCHICSLPQDCIAHLIVHLNDLHSLSREAIAEILDKMDLPGMSIHLGEKNEEPARDS